VVVPLTKREARPITSWRPRRHAPAIQGPKTNVALPHCGGVETQGCGWPPQACGVARALRREHGCAVRRPRRHAAAQVPVLPTHPNPNPADVRSPRAEPRLDGIHPWDPQGCGVGQGVRPCPHPRVCADRSLGTLAWLTVRWRGGSPPVDSDEAEGGAARQLFEGTDPPLPGTPRRRALPRPRLRPSIANSP
jgi:hypothetical protein